MLLILKLLLVFRNHRLLRSGHRQAHTAVADDARVRRGREEDCFLESKNAVVYGGAGAVGSAIARTVAWEGGRVFLLASRRPVSRHRGVAIVGSQNPATEEHV